MPTLIDNYTAFEDLANLPNGTIILGTDNSIKRSSSIIFHNYSDSDYYPFLNEREIQLVEEFAHLEDNWDGESAKAPSANAILKARFIVKFMQATGQKVFHVAPGPNGEIMVDIRHRNKSIELLFYSDKVKYVTFSEDETPTQGIFELNILPELLRWLNA